MRQDGEEMTERQRSLWTVRGENCNSLGLPAAIIDFPVTSEHWTPTASHSYDEQLCERDFSPEDKYVPPHTRGYLKHIDVGYGRPLHVQGNMHRVTAAMSLRRISPAALR
ncbi:hypothetical protein AOLI_G00084240 [Acnodon oligacanthus]